ncbi:hypothetical protein [Kineosporia babensis]|uniref:Uncharacterized protein n=1 Tax=Kineosporia babensis TaxID=499548 RepID=A0A9X1SY92_9ACTN|nr:hypothetical protein [Kineosporia babensis]MCD5310843.1 hypothetical protein [Kineosporia babensis]
MTATTEATKHTCNAKAPGKPLPFGRRGAGCARCIDLENGAEPIQWNQSASTWPTVHDGRLAPGELDAHLTSAHHRSGGCGIVCTYGDS